MRLFVAAEVPENVRREVAAIERPAGADIRWSDPASWHLTLRFLGEVPDDVAARAALAAVSAPATTAVASRTPQRLGQIAVVLPVGGLDAVAEAVGVAFAGLPGEERRRFHGHLTLGRLRRPGRWPAGGVGTLPAEVRWEVTEVVLVRSYLGAGEGGRARYEVLGRQALQALST